MPLYNLVKKVISIYTGHTPNITFKIGDDIKIMELDKFFSDKYLTLGWHLEEDLKEVIGACLDFAKSSWGIENDFDVLLLNEGGNPDDSCLKDVVQAKEVHRFGHHISHAGGAFYQSPFKEALIVSSDGWGVDGNFSIYHANKKTGDFKLIGGYPLNLGLNYMYSGYPLSEVENLKDGSSDDLSIPEKVMSLSIRGNIRGNWLKPIVDFYRSENKDFEKLSEALGLDISVDALSSTEAYDFAATSQRAFEYLFFDATQKHFEKHSSLPICLSGGCALNNLLNEKLREKFGDKLFVPPNPNNGGISLGQLFLYERSKKSFDMTFSGMPLLGEDNLLKVVGEKKAKKASVKRLAKLLANRKSLGIVQGDCEIGVKGLGRRSVLFDASKLGSNTFLNTDINFQEFYIPCPCIIRADDLEKFFHVKSSNYKNFRFGSFSPVLKEEFCEDLRAIICFGNAAFVQVVYPDDNTILYDLLTEFAKLSKYPILINVSFTAGQGVLVSRLSSALEFLDNSRLDAVYSGGYLFESAKKDVWLWSRE